MNSRMALVLALSAAVLFMVVSLSWVLLRFALPQTEWIELGSLADYPPSDQPYKMDVGMVVFLVNNGREILALDPINPIQGGAVVKWLPDERAFIDPGRGSWFDLQGRPIRRALINSIVESHGLRRYPVKIENGMIFIDQTPQTGYPAGEGR